MGFMEGMDRGQAALLPLALTTMWRPRLWCASSMSKGTRHVLSVDELHVLTDDGYSNAEKVARPGHRSNATPALLPASLRRCPTETGWNGR